jgi:molybdopterin molybdotransferase
MRAADWLSIGDALRVMLANATPVGTEQVPLEQACGRTLAEPIISPVDQPARDNSAMDGYAAHAADVRGATESAPAILRVVEEVRAGGSPVRSVGQGEATRIMTGAPVPAGVDSVMRLEHTHDLGDGRIAVLKGGDAGRNVRTRGEDLEAGESVFGAGRLLRPPDIGVLAMVGCTEPLVHRMPRVAVLATGDELVEPDRIADVADGTHVVNSNTPTLAAALHAASCVPHPLGIARDTLTDLRACLARAMDDDALITTAGASVGDHDLVKDALEELGCTTLFWRVKIRPGSPFSFGLIPRPGRPPLPVFGLPGNPVSVLVTFEVLVRPVLRRMQGRTALHPPTLIATAGEAMASPPGLVRFLRVRLDRTGPDLPRAYLTGPQGSGILTSVTSADGLLIMPLETAELPAGARATVLALSGPDDAQETHPY